MPIGRIQLKHGLEASADFNSMLQAEAYYATDTERLMISNGDGTGLLLPSKPEIDTIQDDVDTLANNLNLVQSGLNDMANVFNVSQALTLQNGWSGNLGQPLRWFRFGNLAIIFGEIVRSDTSVAGAVVATLPSSCAVNRFRIEGYAGYVEGTTLRFEVAVPAGRRTIMLAAQVS